jgi:defect in organelle trafficking protein DotA
MPWIFGFFFLFLLISTRLNAQVPLSTALSLAPPASDYSIVFLGNIFGTVEGVISSSGSQIFGHMMGTLNLSVLALGSIVIMYTLIVGTLNTAHEGEFLGKHWSSIWLPVRATVGMTLLIPKSSGYCLMQVLVMWVVVQGVGAADKLWDSALDYLAMGGKLVEEQFDTNKITAGSKANSNPTYNGAVVILTGQVCSYGLQKQLESLRNYYLTLANPSDNSAPTGPCAPDNLTEGTDLYEFCNNPVPDFLSDFNALTYSTMNQKMDPLVMKLPYFNDNALTFYKKLRNAAICGQLSWANIGTQNANQFKQTQTQFGLTQSEMDSLSYSRSIAIQQMIGFLETPARAMVDNDPQINKYLREGDAVSKVAYSQYGVALSDNMKPCNTRDSCTQWGSSNNTNQTVLFAGNEIFNAINAYQGLMQPVLNLLSNGSNTNFQFIQKAKKNGWFFAGGYYFDMIVLSGSPAATDLLLDFKSGLGDDNTKTNLPVICDSSSSEKNPLCSLATSGYLKELNTRIDAIQNLIKGTASDINESVCDGLEYSYNKVNNRSYGYVSKKDGSRDFQSGKCASTTYGYIGNSYFLENPGQPANKGPNFHLPSINPLSFHFAVPKHMQSCKPKFAGFCMGWLFSGLLSVIYVIFNGITQLVFMIMKFIYVMIVVPFILYFFYTLQDAFSYLTNISHNPIVNLANMGTQLIEIGGNLWFAMLAMAPLAAIPGGSGLVIVIIMMVVMPPIVVWVAYFVIIGFTTSFYVPVYPFIIFTFGTIAWLIAVIEAMVAAPIVALGIMSPEGEGILGKSETGMMILVNVFLRPSMMIIGYVAAIMLTYVSIWILNFQFDYVAGFLTDTMSMDTFDGKGRNTAPSAIRAGIDFSMSLFTQIFGYTAYLGLYVSLYITLVQKSFTLIFSLPDKVLRWIGAQQESFGQEMQHWADESKQKLDQMAQSAEKSFGVDTSMLEKQQKILEKEKGGSQGGSVKGSSGDSGGTTT